MILAIKLAYRNLLGAGLRTWLNVIVLSFSFVVIIWMKGLMVGWDRQSKTDMEQWEIGKGQYWHQNYDPYDPFTISNSHAPIPQVFAEDIKKGEVVPMLFAQGSLYNKGRMQTVMIKGIPANQKLLKIPAYKLDTALDAVPAIIGANMARQSHLERGSLSVLRWRDNHGTFDAVEIQIVDIFTANVPQVDVGQVWISLKTLQEKMVLPDEATVISTGAGAKIAEKNSGFVFKSPKELTKDIDEMIKTKSVSQSIFYGILLLLAMLAIFDTQILSIFRRQKEIGTYVALGYTRNQVVGLFTVEGAMHAVLAALVAAAYGIPFFVWQAKVGLTVPMDSSEFGMALSPVMYPVYSVSLILSTTMIVTLTTTLVSYWPSRRIAKMNPTDALRGKIQ